MQDIRCLLAIVIRAVFGVFAVLLPEVIVPFIEVLLCDREAGPISVAAVLLENCDFRRGRWHVPFDAEVVDGGKVFVMKGTESEVVNDVGGRHAGRNEHQEWQADGSYGSVARLPLAALAKPKYADEQREHQRSSDLKRQYEGPEHSLTLCGRTNCDPCVWRLADV